MILFDENGNVIKHGAIYIADIYRLQDIIPPFRRKLKIKLRKEVKVGHDLNYAFEVYYAVKVFQYFIRLMLTDVITKQVRYRHNAYKTINLRTVDNPVIKAQYCRRLGCLPTMPIISITANYSYRGKIRHKNITVYNDMLELFGDILRDGKLTSGIREDRTAEDYVDLVNEKFPALDKKTILKIIKEGVNGLFLGVKNRRADVVVNDGKPATHKICQILNINAYDNMLSHYAQLTRYLQKFKDDNYYAIFTNEEQQKIEAGEKEVSGLAIYTLAYVQLFAKGNHKRDRYKHIYKIKRTDRSSYTYLIQRTNVKTNRIKYLYRRVNDRYERINDTK